MWDCTGAVRGSTWARGMAQCMQVHCKPPSPPSYFSWSPAGILHCNAWQRHRLRHTPLEAREVAAHGVDHAPADTLAVLEQLQRLRLELLQPFGTAVVHLQPHDQRKALGRRRGTRCGRG